VLRNVGARLAVPLLTVIVIATLAMLAAEAGAVDECRPTPTGIVCGFGGASTSTSLQISAGSLPPLRYLATSSGSCWYWSRYSPGLDSWDSANDQMIILTRFRLPECSGRPNPTTVVVISERAWEVFRAFPLDPPWFGLTPRIGITNLPSRLHLRDAPTLAHREALPDGRILEVEAWVDRVWVSWADGTPTEGFSLSRAAGDPGEVRHTYALKTCPPGYREGHIDGLKCHPELERYPVVVTFEWRGRYRAAGGWIGLGSIDRSDGLHYDVDEVLGILVEP
jgi:hypothetical protein